MIAFYCVFALVIILFGVKSYIGYQKVIKPDQYAEDLPLASDAIPFWRYHESNGKCRRKRCKIAFYKFKAKLKRRKK